MGILNENCLPQNTEDWNNILNPKTNMGFTENENEKGKIHPYFKFRN
jgi:hypothetical protein